MIQFIAKIQDKKKQLHLQSVSLPSVQKGGCYYSIRIFNKLRPHNVKLCENKMAFKTTIKKFLIKMPFIQ